MGGLMGGGGSGGGSVNPFASAGGTNAYGTQGPGGGAPWGIGDSPTAIVGSLNDPVTQAPVQIQGGQPPPAPDTPAPTGQQSGGSNDQSWMDSVSNILLGKDSNQVGSMQAQATGAGGGPPTPTQSRPLTQPGAAPQTGEPGAIGNPAGDFTPTGNANPAPTTAGGSGPIQQTPPFTGMSPVAAIAAQNPAGAAGGPNPPAQLPLPPQPFPTEEPAAVLPQSPQISGKKNANAAPDTAAATPPTAPDQYSSQGYTKHGAGYGDTGAGAGAATEGATAVPGAQGTQSIGGKGNALGDLLQGNFGRFFGDLFGGQGMAGGAGQPAPSAPTGNTSPPGTPSPDATASAAPALPVTPTGIPNPQATPPTQLAGTSTGLPDQAARPGTTPSPTGVATAAPAAPAGVAAAEAATPPGAPTDGATVGTPGTMTTGPAGAGFESRPGDEGGAHPLSGVPAPMGSGQNWWGRQPPDYFQRHGGRVGADITRVNTPYGPVSVNKQVAPDLMGLTQDMQAAGIPGITKLGGFNDRQKRFGKGPSSHSYGAAVDMNDAVAQDPRTKAWINQHPQQWQDMLRRHNFAQYMPSDPNHLEWVGPQGGGRGTASAATPRWAGSLQNPAGPLTRGDRNMNPGNIKWGPDARAAGATGQDSQGHAVFPNVQAGIQAQANLLRRNYNNKTVPEMGRSYATDRGWAKGVMAAGGFRPNDRLNLNDPATMDRLQRAIWRQEGTHPQTAQRQAPGTAAATPGTMEQGARAMGFTPGQGSPEGRPLSQPTSTGPQASSTTYEDELRNRGQANVARQLAYVPGAGQLEAIARSALQPTHIGKDFAARRPSLGTQAGLSDIERLLYGWGGPSQ